MSHNTHSTVGQRGVERQESTVQSKTPQFGLRSHAGPRLSTPGYPRSGSPRQLHRGINLTEVLIAMGILTVGLLGVASLFPVASFYMQKGDIADRGSAVAQAAFNELLSRGMLDPESWYALVPSSGSQPNTVFNADRENATYTLYRNTYTRPFAATFREAQAQGMTTTQLSQNFGGGFVIDPMGVNAFAVPNSNVGIITYNFIAAPFPSSFYRWFTGTPPAYSPWAPWGGVLNSPLRRLTFRDASSGWQLGTIMADRLFRSSDDLSLDVSAPQDRPSIQRLTLADSNSDGKGDSPLARESAGNYSWLATVLPTTTEAFLGLAQETAGNAYEVSVAVIHKRILPSATPTDNNDVGKVAAEERMVRARIMSTGLSGGEVLLERHANDLVSDVPESPFQQLRTGQWILLCGPHPSSTDERPLFVARWYRVVSIEGKDGRLDINGNPATNPAEPERRIVSLRGPQWPWQPGSTLAANELPNSLCASIIPNVVAVHSKTIRLEGKSAWSAN